MISIQTAGNRMAAIAAALLFLVPTLIPVQATPVPTFWAEWVAVVLGMAVCVILTRNTSAGAWRLPPMSIGLVLFAGVLLVQIAMGRVSFPDRSLLAIGCALWAALLVACGHALARSGSTGITIACCQVGLVATAFLGSLAGLMQRYEISVAGFHFGTVHLVGLMGQRNHLADIVSCGFWTLPYLMRDRLLNMFFPLMRARSLHPVTALLLAAPMALALTQSATRAVWVYATIALIVAAVSRWRAGNRDVLRWTLIALVVLILAQILTAGESGARAALLVTGPEGFHASGELRRALLARYGLVMFSDAPLLGVGWSEFAWSTLVLAPRIGEGLGPTTDFHAHNLVLQLLAETGLAGAACILVPLAIWFRRFRWCWAPAYCWIVTTVCIMLFHSMTEFPLWYAYFLGPFALLIGLGSRPVVVDLSPSPPPSRFASVCFGVAAIVATAWLSIAALDYGQLVAWQREVQRVEAGGGRINAEQFEELSRLAGTTFGSRVVPALAIHAAVGTTEETAAALALAEQALHAHPMPAVAEHTARLLEQAGHPANAAAIRQNAARLFSGSP